MKDTSLIKDQFFFSGKDCKALFKMHRHHYVKMCIYVLAGSLLFNLCKEPKFRSEAKFKKAYDGQDVSSRLKSVLPILTPATSQVSAGSVMKSRSFLKDVVARLGLQASVEERGFLKKKLSFVFDNIFAEMGRRLSAKERFIFSDVFFEGVESEKFYLRPLSNKTYELLSSDGEVMALASIGQRVVFPSGSFILQHMPKKAIAQRKYPLTLNPWEPIVKGLQKTFTVKEDKSDKDVLLLAVKLSHPKLSADFLDFVMKRHVEYVKEESASVLQDHLDYFEGRKKDLEGQYTHFLEDHVAYLKDNLQTDGFMGVRQEVAALERPSEEYYTKLYEVELELSRLKPVVAARSQSLDKDKAKSEQQKLELASDKKDKALSSKEKKMLLEQEERALQNKDLFLPEKVSQTFLDKASAKDQTRSEILAYADTFLTRECARFKEQIEAAKYLLSALENGEALKGAIGPARPLTPLIYSMVESLIETEPKASQEKIDALKKTLIDFLAATDSRQRALLERHKDDSSISLELEGLTPENAQQLYLDYNRELDSVYLTIRQLGYLKDQIYDPDIELSSLCNLLTDPVSQKMIERAAQMALELRDDSNRSVKEHERIKDSLTLQKNFLSHHVMQMIELQKMRAALIEDKIASLQSSSVHLLSTEKKLIEDRLLSLRSKMSSSLPTKWKMENQLQLKKELFIRMIEGIAHLEESKRVDQNILPSAYKVLDAASLPLMAERPGLILYPAFFSLLSSFCLFGIGLFRRFLHGSPISSDLLRHYEMHCSGAIGPHGGVSLEEIPQKDLETLRHIAHFASCEKRCDIGLCVGLFGRKKADYCSNLAALFAMKGSRVLVIDALFSPFARKGRDRGLLPFLQGEIDQPEVVRGDGFDLIYSGGYVRNYLELISQPLFEQLIQKKRHEYDFVIIHTEALAGSTEALIYQSFADVCIVSAGFEDSIEHFDHFIHWQQKRNRECLSFVLREI